jgi:selenide,water dikinase
VYSLDDSRALVFTADFFTPVVDAPYDFGAVAAANALSDVYAMGGEPTIALNIAGFPSTLPPDVIGEILRGGAEKAWDAGCVLVGGHTICSQEPIYGLAVIGFVDPHRMFVKTGVRAGDSLILTKPLGMGVITTALKRGIAPAAVLARAVTSMTSLNRDASRILALHGVAACTDVTGFSILGHGLELARKSAKRALSPGSRRTTAPPTKPLSDSVPKSLSSPESFSSALKLPGAFLPRSREAKPGAVLPR